MSTPRNPVLRALTVHSRKIALGVLCAGLLGVAAHQLTASPEPAPVAADLTAARATALDDTSRDYLRAATSAVPAPTPSAAPKPKAKPKPKPVVKRTATAATPASCKAYTGNKLTACKLLPSFGFGYSQMSPLVKLWQHESGWNHRAENGGSGAYGIPQALPGSKMAKFGDDWKTNPATQIKWGLDYIKNRYDTPAGAWKHFQDNSWY